MAAFALVKDGLVTNMIVWDGIVSVAFDGEAVPFADGAGIGSTWDGQVFTPPPPEEPPPPSSLELLVNKLVENKVITKEDAGTIGVEVAVSVEEIP